MSRPVVGIDLGTTHCALAHAAGGAVTVICPVPSVVTEMSTAICGTDALPPSNVTCSDSTPAAFAGCPVALGGTELADAEL